MSAFTSSWRLSILAIFSFSLTLAILFVSQGGLQAADEFILQPALAQVSGATSTPAPAIIPALPASFEATYGGVRVFPRSGAPISSQVKIFFVENSTNQPIFDFIGIAPGTSIGQTTRINLATVDVPSQPAPAFTQVNGDGGWKARIYFLGNGPDGKPVYQINIYGPDDVLYSDGFLFSR
jgi:hypothetical protein